MKFKLPFEKNPQTHTKSMEGIVRIEAVPTTDNFDEATLSLQHLNEEEANLIEEKQNLTSLRENLLLKELSSEETKLIEERQNLASLKEKLQLKIHGKIEQKKNKLQKLRDEIKELKFSCEQLTQTLTADTNVK